MNGYGGLHARHYDLVYADKAYESEARFVDAQLLAHGVRRGELLELACGSGRHAAAMDGLGWTVTGVDCNPDLLGLARARAPGLTFELQDMRELDLGEPRFAACTCLFDSIGYLLEDAHIVSALRAVRRHLRQGGLAVMEFLHSAAVLRDSEPVRVRRWKLPGGGRLIRVSETTLDVERSVMTVDYELFELKDDGSPAETWSEAQRNRFFSATEFTGLLERAGFTLRALTTAYEIDAAIDPKAWHLMAVAE